jgi:hypothetical protein
MVMNKQPNLGLRVRRGSGIKKEPRCNINHLMKKWEKLPEQSEESVKRAIISIFSAGTGGIGANERILLSTSRSGVRDSVVRPMYEAINASDLRLSSEELDWFMKWIAYMMTTEYQVDIQNDVDDDLDNLTVVYFQNALVGGKIVTSGPFTKSLAALPQGEAAGFSLCPCLYMVDKYAIQFEYAGNPYSFQEDIPTLNAQELADFGKIDYCGDTLEIAFL